MVGMTGFEPATSRPPDARATRLRYIPMFYTGKFFRGSGGKVSENNRLNPQWSRRVGAK